MDKEAVVDELVHIEVEESGDDRPWIDKGWAWVIVAGSFAVNFAAIGQMRCVGVYFTEIQKLFQESSMMVSIMPSIIFFVAPVMCLISSVLTSCFGSRPVVLIGILLIALAHTTLIFSTNIIHVLIFYSIPFGVGVGMVYASAIVLVSKYFVRYRSTAQGISMAGFSLTGIILPLIISPIREEFGFRGAMVIIGGILLQTAIAACLFRPPEFWETSHNRSHETSTLINRKEYTDSDTKTQLSFSHSTLLNPAIARQVQAGERLFKSEADLSDKRKQMKSTEMISLDVLGHSVRASRQEIASMTNIRKEENVVLDRNLLLEKFKSSVQFSLLKDVPFLIHLAVAICGFIGYQMTYTILPSHAKDLGFTSKEGYFLITIGCIGEFPARILISFLADKWSATKYGHRFHIISVCLFISGISIIMLGFATSYLHLAIGTVFVGFFCAGGFLSINVDVLRDAIGLEKLTNGGLGLNLCFQGITLSSCTMCMGLLRDGLGSYKIPFIMVGCITIAGGLITWLQIPAKKMKSYTS